MTPDKQLDPLQSFILYYNGQGMIRMKILDISKGNSLIQIVCMNL